MKKSFYASLENELEKIREEGLFKEERFIASPQKTRVELANGSSVLNFCANDYLGLANNLEVKKAASESVEKDGFGMASVRFICGTNDKHRQLEEKLSSFLGYEDCILYVACFDANGGLFEPLFDENDAIISDALNHASIIDGIRLCKAKRFRYEHSNMSDLKRCLEEAKEQGARHKIIVSDGVFSMDGTYAKLDEICSLANEYEALVMIDDCHATGFVGCNGRGTSEHFGIKDGVDILTGTLGKALGGASGGFVCANKSVVELLKQKSRPYLFSNALSPSIVSATMKALEIVESQPDRRQRIYENSKYFRGEMKKLGFEILGTDHPIVPVMLGDSKVAQHMSKKILENGIYAVGFFYPVVPKNKARIRLQINSEHTKEELDKVIDTFKKVGEELNLL